LYTVHRIDLGLVCTACIHIMMTVIQK